VAATHRDLAAMVAAGSFRQDLFFRLNVIAIETPALAQRVDDIPDLAWFFVARLAAELGRKPPALAPSALAALGRHPWPGNIRELRNVLERALVLCEADPLEAGHLTLGAAGPREDGDGGTLAEQVAALERRRIEQALRAARGRKVDAARALGISRPTLDKKVKDYAIDIFAEGE
jgi:DNA-binding NtrC family response regulator